MAATATTSLCYYSSSSIAKRNSPSPSHSFSFLLPSRTRTRNAPRTLVVTAATDFLGDFGARDPFPEEIASNFGEKVLGFMSTEHKILIPNASVLSLAQLSCSPVSALPDRSMSYDDAKQLLFKVVGWRLFEDTAAEDGKTVLKLRCLWKLRDFSCGAELIGRIAKVAEEAGHFPVLHLEKNNQVRAELWTEELGGLSLNDFIVAAKIDEIKTSDLVPRKRVWA